MIKWIYIGFYAIFKNVNYLFGVSVDNVGVFGMEAAGVSGTTPMTLLSFYTLSVFIPFLYL